MKKVKAHGLTWIIDDEVPEGKLWSFSMDDLVLNKKTGVFELKRNKKDEELEI